MSAWHDQLMAGGVYALTPVAPDRRSLLDQVRQALTGGVGMLQYRDKSVNTDERQRTAEALREMTREFGVPLIINDHVDLAVAVAADGVHLGVDDVTLAEAREQLPLDSIIGVSCYNDLQRAAALAAAGADYLAFGSLFPSGTKPEAVHCPDAVLTQARQRFDLPIVAIGGINIENAPKAIQAGAHWLAVIDGLFSAPDISIAAQTLKAATAAANS